MPNLFEAVSTFALRALLTEKQQRVDELLCIGAEAKWATLSLADQDSRLAAAELSSKDCALINASLLARLPDDDPPRQAQRQIIPIADGQMPPGFKPLFQFAGSDARLAEHFGGHMSTPDTFTTSAGSHRERPRFIDQATGQPIAAVMPGESFAAATRADRAAHADEWRDIGLDGLIRAQLGGTIGREVPPIKAAMAAGTGPSGGFMAPEILAAKIHDLWRNAARFTQAGATVLPMGSGTVTMATVESDPTIASKAENARMTVSDMTFGQRRLVSRAYAGAIKVSRELILDASNARSVIEQALGSALAVTVDLACLSGDGLGANILGALNHPGVQLYDAAGKISAKLYAPFSQALGKLLAVNCPSDNLALLHGSQVATALDLLADQTDQPLQPPPSWAGIRKLMTNQLASGSGFSYPILGDFSQAVLGVQHDAILAVSEDASDPTTSDSAFLQDQIWIRVVARLDMVLVRPAHFCKIKVTDE